jgi:hypothetical protein
VTQLMSMQRSVQLLDAIINLRFTMILILRHLTSPPPPWLNSSRYSPSFPMSDFATHSWFSSSSPSARRK